MTLQQTPYTELLLFAAVVSASIAVYAFQKYRTATRNRQALLYFGVLMAASAAWSGTYAIGLSEAEFGAKVFWLGVTNVYTVIVPAAWLAFALAYTDREHLLTRRTWLALSVEPIVVTVAALTAKYHDFYYYDLQLTNDPGFLVVSRELGPVFVLHAAYSYALVVAGALAFLQFVRLDDDTYRIQAILLVGGGLLPVVSNAAFVLELFGDGVNLTSVVLGISGLAFALAIKRYRFFDLAPVARDTVVERMREGYVVCDEDGTIVDSNPSAARYLGVDDDLVGTQIESVLPEIDVVHDVAGNDGDAGSHGEAAKRRVKGTDGALALDGTRTEVVREVGDELRYVDVAHSPLDVVDGTLVVLRDITDQRRAERRFQTLIERSSDVITIVDRDGVVDYVSPSIERLLGVDPETAVGESLFSVVHPEDRDDVRAAFEAAVTDADDVSRVEYRVRRADGEWRVHEAVGRNLLDDPDVEGVVVNARDVTERRERERELEVTNERLERFASVVSHDLRNPLNVADGYAELLEDRVDDPAVAEIRTSHDRMRRIIEDVLALARNDDGVSDRGPVALASLATDAWEGVDTGEATLKVNDGSVYANRTRLARVFENLFRNSVDHAGGDVTVEVGIVDDGDGFYVADDGPGIPVDLQDSLFAEGVSGDDGTGLGLAIVAEIVRAHGWTVDVDPTADGARFEVRAADHVVLAEAV